MRCMLRRCSADKLSTDIARRLAIEIRTEELEHQFLGCVDATNWEVALLPKELAKFKP
jgi:hypothetical protein